MKKSAFNRAIEFLPLIALARGKTVLDIGGNVGMMSYEAIKNGAKEIVLLDNKQENIDAALHILGSLPNVEVRLFDLLNEQISKAGFVGIDTVFYLAVHQHLEKLRKGAGMDVLNDLVFNVKPRFICFRTREFEDDVSIYLKNNYGPMVYYSHFDPDLGAVLVHTSRTND